MTAHSGNPWGAFEALTARMVETARSGDWVAVAALQGERDALPVGGVELPGDAARQRLHELDRTLLALVREARDAAGQALSGARHGQQATRAYSEHTRSR